MGSLDNVRKLKQLRKEKLDLHTEHKKCAAAGDRIGMQRYRNKITAIDTKILAILKGEK